MNRRSQHTRRNPSHRNHKLAMLAGAVGVMLLQQHSPGATYFWDQAKVHTGNGSLTAEASIDGAS